MIKILGVEDDDSIAKPLAKDLKHQQHIVEIASNGIEGWEYAQAINYESILLDLMLQEYLNLELLMRHPD